MATTDARRALPQLVGRMGAKRKPSAHLMHDAIDIGPHRKGGAGLLPEVDVAAHAVEIARQRAPVAELEDELEDAGMAHFLLDRLASIPGGTADDRGGPHRLVYRNGPSGGAIATMLVLAIERRGNTIAYARASSRLARREAAKRTPSRRTLP